MQMLIAWLAGSLIKARTYLSIAEPTDPNFLVLLRQNLPTYTYPTFCLDQDILETIWRRFGDIWRRLETFWRHFTGWLAIFGASLHKTYINI